MAEERWMVRPGKAAPIVRRYSMDGRLARIVSSRTQEEEVDSYLNRTEDLFDPRLLRDCQKTCEILQDKLSSGKKVCILGDYDVDGVMSETILYLGMKELFPKADLICRIPERIQEGYGFNRKIAEELSAEGVDTVITCDNGISAFDCGPFLSSRHMTFLITDHHEIQKDEDGHETLPQADAVVNPHREGDRSPQKTICGAFVAYQLIRLLTWMVRGKEEDTPALNILKGYAAFGTVCDVMPLIKQNRKLVYQGLRYFNQRPTMAVRTLMQVSSTRKLTSESVGYYIGPLINAGGRLGSQNKFLRLFLTTDPEECLQLCTELSKLNQERQQMTILGEEEAEKILESSDASKVVKVVYLPDCSESIAGLIAGKLKEKFYRPALVLVRTENGLKGSGRSIEAYPMYEELAKIRPFFSRMGGHAMAAGFSIDCQKGEEQQKVRELDRLLNERCPLHSEDIQPLVYIDSTMQASHITSDWISRMEILEPYGTGNPEPALAQKHMKLLKARTVGARQKVVQLLLCDEDGLSEGVCFDKNYVIPVLQEAGIHDPDSVMAQGSYLDKPIEVDVVYHARIDSFQGYEKPKVVVTHMRLSRKD